jgi:hypothetical protein
MREELPQREPVASYQRKTISARRVGADARCACGESRPEALITGSSPTFCAACDRDRQGMTAFDDHHFAGKANSPETVPIWVNDHRAWLSEAQREWPTETLENPNGSPLLAAAAMVRGLIDTVSYLLKNLLWVAQILETLDAFLTKTLGPKSWTNTELEKFSPRKKSNDKKQI